jgi:hypothetical protein
MSTHVAPVQSGKLSISTAQNGKPAASLANENSEEVKAILEAVRSTRFGEITVIVQDGFVVQINRLEKRRLR